ncbi:MAG: hypothetical protein NVS9B1_04500 [Candidatus Dormibacteraceae bacterium]
MPHMPEPPDEATEGGVRVANEVIASIAAMAAAEIDGVAGMDETNARHFGDWLSRQSAHRGVRVRLEGRSIHLELFLQVASTAVVPQVAERVQGNVVEAVERMLGLHVAAVDVFVSSVAFPATV